MRNFLHREITNNVISRTKAMNVTTVKQMREIREQRWFFHEGCVLSYNDEDCPPTHDQVEIVKYFLLLMLSASLIGIRTRSMLG
jgi:hypothetical protein